MTWTVDELHRAFDAGRFGFDARMELIDGEVFIKTPAHADIAEYWIVSLVDRVLEVHRAPSPLPGQPPGHHYRSITRYGEDRGCFAARRAR